ncbi:glycosyltransferase family 2 protein [Allonocardiopsis opalescens]|uniref:GT2 family glycosyltransferase n=1 Tax=Allonocardiopsis opalescens TaxID=1144618 RepID=A0A2T0PXC1_9ACTN|nr:glycosyltransferase [Allonocardiopsis opalescens]PRX96184.1 GT2 family glycosyltransferase [Allonocardiopsis opalescens]
MRTPRSAPAPHRGDGAARPLPRGAGPPKAAGDAGGGARTSVVIATRDRRDELLETLDRLAALPERPPVVVVDNGSADGTPAAVRAAFPRTDVVALGRNRGAVARNVGVLRARTRYVAFCDDDSWWEPGALDRAADAFDACPALGLLAARTLVGERAETDPVSTAMAASPLRDRDGVPGTPVLGFLACSAVVRRDAFLSVGGFSELLFFAGEESVVAFDLAAAGWLLRYRPDVLAHHRPSPARPPARSRLALQRRNALLSAWLRRPVRTALAATGALAGEAVRDPASRAALAAAAARLPAALLARRRLPAPVEHDLRILAAAEPPA